MSMWCFGAVKKGCRAEVFACRKPPNANSLGSFHASFQKLEHGAYLSRSLCFSVVAVHRLSLLLQCQQAAKCTSESLGS